MFHSRNTSAMAAGSIPATPRRRWYASPMSCMSEYSIPLCTIFTKWPEPSSPMWVQHAVPSTLAEMSSSMGPTTS